MAFQILVVEDDLPIGNLIAATLQIRQYQVTILDDGEKASRELEQRTFDLALLDIMLPGKNGYELLPLMKKKHIPVIFLSAKTQLADRVYGLNLGAEDYITKPFEPLELLARVDVALRRLEPETRIIREKDVTLDRDGRTVQKSGQQVELTKMEYELLEFLMLHPNMVFSREKLLDCVWGYDYMGNSRTVDMHIKNLRAKLDFTDVICTVYKIGYKLVKKE